MTRIGYARVSTRTQHEESQHDLLTEARCERIFTDKISGKLASRPQWDACRDYLRAGDTLVVTRMSRLAHSTKELLSIAAGLAERGIELHILRQQIDTSTPAGRLLFTMLAAYDEFLADLIVEGTREGLAAARARGRTGGRPPAMTPAAVAQAQQLYDARQHTVEEIAQILKVSRATLYRHLTKTTSTPAPAGAEDSTREEPGRDRTA